MAISFPPLLTISVASADTLTIYTGTSAEASEEAAAQLAPRLAAQAPASDQEGGFPVAEFEWLRDAGLLTAPLSKALGGTDLHLPAHTLTLLRTLKHIGRGNLAVGRVYEGHVNALQLMQRYARPKQTTRWAADAHAGHLFGVWNTQADDGVRLEPLAGGRFRLMGSKTFGSGAGHVTRPLITGALPDGGWQMFILPADELSPTLDASFWQPLGMRATASFRIDLTGLEISAEEFVGKPGDYYRQPDFSGGAIRFAAVQLGAAEAVFNETRRFLQQLNRTDDPYQQMRLGELAGLVESGNLWLRGAADHASRPTAASEATATVAYANLVRTAMEDICLRVLQIAERCVGARGLLRPEPFERLHRDLTHYLRQPAPDAAIADAGRFALTQTEPAHQLWHR
ncbi:Acyl-CoA dehydrogenase type 2 domain [Hymenobacter roseosalivarius DSM 11622]|uniref:Acyl-CoA dehydrogenase type 2 domain n=1 Tax=Hymenobacter roseosalivarius DSM 11622 TaxID=645990 RepID=A0A1W1V2I6_9BACT|nr:acyl-CoA dehydrogenase family protein [Hymenobacter roseosalivarius]SMB87518.1 Acyl-CoA dehydrogenase type 2 domain [Hymenobacter roseosalivarius DSM 11622]